MLIHARCSKGVAVYFKLFYSIFNGFNFITFKLNFKDGSSGSLKLDSVDENRMVLDAVLDKPVTGGKGFLALRSMYVTEFNNDVARIALREPGSRSWREEALMTYPGGKATEIGMGRATHSRHNTSSPDMIFRSFSKDPNPPAKAEAKK